MYIIKPTVHIPKEATSKKVLDEYLNAISKADIVCFEMDVTDICMSDYIIDEYLSDHSKLNNKKIVYLDDRDTFFELMEDINKNTLVLSSDVNNATSINLFTSAFNTYLTSNFNLSRIDKLLDIDTTVSNMVTDIPEIKPFLRMDVVAKAISLVKRLTDRDKDWELPLDRDTNGNELIVVICVGVNHTTAIIEKIKKIKEIRA